MSLLFGPQPGGVIVVDGVPPDVGVEVVVVLVPDGVGLQEPVPLARNGREGRIFSTVF